MNKQHLFVLSVIVILVGTLLIVGQVWRGDRGRQVEELEYPVFCINCGHETSWTSRQMEKLIAEKQVVSPPNESRRFACPECSEKQVVMKAILQNEY